MTTNLLSLFHIQPHPLLSDIPDLQIKVACPKCGYGWHYDRDERIGKLGDILVLQFVWRVTKTCKRRGSLRIRVEHGWWDEGDARNDKDWEPQRRDRAGDPQRRAAVVSERLSEIEGHIFRAACIACARAWQVDLSTLIKQMGDVEAAHALWRLTRNCCRRNPDDDRCQARLTRNKGSLS